MSDLPPHVCRPGKCMCDTAEKLIIAVSYLAMLLFVVAILMGLVSLFL